MSDATSNDLQVTDRAALRTMLEERSDDEINELVGVLGFDQLFGMVIPAMTARLDADKAAGQTATVQFDVADTEGATHSFHLAVDGGKATGAEGVAETPRMTLSFSTPAFLRFLAGSVDPMQAFMSGQLKLSGDMVFAMTFQNWFSME